MTISIKKVILEMLTPNQRKIVDRWPETRAPENISGHVIPRGQDRITIPLEDPHDSPSKLIKHHLAQHGYEVADYSAGHAKDKYGRITKIGKALNATKADKSLIDKFNVDPDRTNPPPENNHSKLQVVISRHPHDVAGMSTGQKWDSCMNMVKGANRDFLPHEVAQGTHVAYLTHAGDHMAEKPLARIALKPFREEKSERTILHPEHKVYGEGPTAFEHTVHKWANEHFPLKDNTFYSKHTAVYDDSHATGKVISKVHTITPEKIASLSTASNNIAEIQSKANKAKHVAMFGSDEQRALLKDHPNPSVRQTVADFSK